jgi:hypothetical protein
MSTRDHRRTRTVTPGMVVSVSALLWCLLAMGSARFGIELGTLGPGVSAAAELPASASRTIFLTETGRLHLTSKHNFTLNEQGSASGTAAGTIYVHLTAVSSTRVTAEVNIYARGGSISGYGTGGYRRAGTTASFSGSMSIDRGSGSFAHIHGSGLSFAGTVQESSSDAIVVHVSGSVSD